MYGFEELYKISTYGRVKRKDRIAININGEKTHYKEKMLSLQYKTTFSSYTQVQVNLWKDRKSYSKIVARLVAETFIPNPMNLPQVNHIDENPLNNHVSNLEWCTARYNNNYGGRISRANKTKSKSINMYDLNFNFIRNYESIKNAAEDIAGDDSSIVKVCKGKNSSHKGYIFKYA